jgi:hypothetical protein
MDNRGGATVRAVSRRRRGGLLEERFGEVEREEGDK